MKTLTRLLSRLQAAMFRRRREAEMAEEMRLHLEQRTRENLAAGMSAEEAGCAAQRQFGGVDLAKEACRDEWNLVWLSAAIQHVRVCFRLFAKSPGFTSTALITLALCLGANLTIFAVVDAILLRPLPFPSGRRLVTMYYVYPRLPSATPGASLTNYYERRGKIPALDSMAGFSRGTTVIGEPGATTIESRARVTADFFSTLGVAPLLGRAFNDGEMTYQTDNETIISYEYWQSQLSADPAIIGKQLRIDGIPRVVVGVLPPHFRFLALDAPIYSPLSSEEGERNIGARHSVGMTLVGRLAPGATLAEAQAQIDARDAVLAPEFPDAKIVAESGCHTIVASLHDDFVAPARPLLLLLQGGALLLLVIGGVNLANLFLIRASARAREFAVRQALGANRSQVLREVLTETVLLTLGGGVIALGVGAVGVRLVASLGADQLPLGTEIDFNLRIAGVVLGVAVLAGIVLGLSLGWFILRHRLGQALQGESRGNTSGRAALRLRHGFIVAQVALAFVLLIGAGLLGLSLKKAAEVAPGFRADHVITGQFTLTWKGYHDNPSYAQFFGRLAEKTRALPGVAATGVISNLPLGGNGDGNVMTVPGYVPKPGESVGVHDEFAVAGDYFSAMGIPLLAGRYLDSDDMGHGRSVCLVDEVFARHYWPAGTAVGKAFYRGTQIDPKDTPFTVVGVVGTVKQTGMTDTNPRGQAYFPYDQAFRRNFYLVARTSLPPENLALTLMRTIREIDPDMPLTDLRTMAVRVDDSLMTRRSPALLAGIFGATALALAVVGLYAVMAYSVAQRTTEFGIRMALGAQQAEVLRLVFGQGFRLTLAGLAVGLLAALSLTGFMADMLFDVKARDPLAFLGIAALLAAVAAVSCLLPARRATRVDPIVALRSE